MKAKDINIDLSPERLENLFTVSKDSDGNFYYNLTETIQIDDNIPSSMLGRYDVTGKMSWHNISFDIYGTTNLWWAILAVNKNFSPIVLPEKGDIIYFIQKDTVISIMDALKNA